MLRSLAVARIQQGLGFRSDRAEEIISALQEEQRDLEKGKTLPRFLLVEDQALSLLTGENAVVLPTGFIRRFDMPRYTPLSSTVPVFIPWRTYDQAFRAYIQSDPAGPKVAALRQASVYFFPEADRDYDLTWTYYKAADLLTADIENAWLLNAPELLIGGAGMRIAKDMRNQSAIQLFSDIYKQSRISVFSEEVAAEQEDEIVMGADN